MTRIPSIAAIALVLTACGGEAQRTEEASNGGGENAALAEDAPSDGRDAEIPTYAADATFTGMMIADDGTPVEVRYVKVGELAIAGGDMIVGTHDQMQQRLRLFRDLQDGDVDSALPAPQREALEEFADKAARAGEGASRNRLSADTLRVFGWGTNGQIWPSRTIPYQIGSSIPPGIRRQRIEAAVAIWNQQSPVILRPAAQVPEAERRGSAVLTFVDHEAPDNEFACASWVGYRRPSDGTQEIFINPPCEAGNIAHEIGHAIGLHHEHQRLDRTSLLSINANVPADSVNYGTLAGRRLSNHDLCSIMHYGARTTTPRWFTLTAPGQQAFQVCEQALSPSCRAGEPGQRCQLSQGDIESLRNLYR